MYERVDTSSTVAIEQDPVAMVRLLLGCVAFVAVGVWMINYQPQSANALIAGWVGICFFGLCVVAIVARLLLLRGPALIVSPQGLTDRRPRRAQLLRWSDVRSVGEWSHRGQRMVLLGLSSEAKERLATRTAGGAFLSKVNAALGADGRCIQTSGLKASFNDIRNLITAFANAHANLDSSASSRLVRQS